MEKSKGGIMNKTIINAKNYFADYVKSSLEINISNIIINFIITHLRLISLSELMELQIHLSKIIQHKINLYEAAIRKSKDTLQYTAAHLEGKMHKNTDLKEYNDFYAQHCNAAVNDINKYCKTTVELLSKENIELKELVGNKNEKN